MMRLVSILLVVLVSCTAFASTFIARVSSMAYCQANSLSTDLYEGLVNTSYSTREADCGLPTEAVDATDLDTVFVYVFDRNDGDSVTARICYSLYSSSGSLSCGTAVSSGAGSVGFFSLQIYPPAGSYSDSYLPFIRVQVPSYDLSYSSFKGFSYYKT